MRQYRKKPIVIGAVQWLGTAEQAAEIVALDPKIVDFKRETPDKIYIQTLEGLMTASPEDWIIQGVKGELYPCKPDVFRTSYEPV